ncbi:MAG: NUDIX hydrolase [Bradymonadia bacterium]
MSPQDEELAYLEAYDPNHFDRPSVAVDLVILTVDEGGLQVLLAEREQLPLRGRLALPGGFVRVEEPLEVAAARLLAAKGSITDVYLEQLYTFGAPGRDPRMRVISVAYVALVAPERMPEGNDKRRAWDIEVPWAGEEGGPVIIRGPEGPVSLAFDHEEMIALSVKRLRGKLAYTPIGYQFLGETFTLRALQGVHEAILGRPLNKDSFRRRMLASGELTPTGLRESAVGHRPAELYRFTHRSAV